MAEEGVATVRAEVLLVSRPPGGVGPPRAEQRGEAGLWADCVLRSRLWGGAEPGLEPLGVRGETGPRSWELVRLGKADFFAARGLCWDCGPSWGALDGKGRFSSEMALLLVPSFLSREVWKGSPTVYAETVCVNPQD